MVLGAKTADPDTMNRLIALSDRMADVVHFDGYTHAQLETILDGVDVGMIPVQWEDNLPQVATEMVAHGVPLITSHRGGAKELGGDNPSFVFKASDKEALIEIWRQLIEGELQPGDYWASAMSLTTMDDHLNRLMELWANPEAPQRGHPSPGGCGRAQDPHPRGRGRRGTGEGRPRRPPGPPPPRARALHRRRQRDRRRRRGGAGGAGSGPRRLRNAPTARSSTPTR